MILQLKLFLVTLVRGELLKASLKPFIETNVTFETDGVKLLNGGVATKLSDNKDDKMSLTLIPETGIRGIFVRVCDVNDDDLRKVKIHALKYASKGGSIREDMIDIEKLFTDFDIYNSTELSLLNKKLNYGKMYKPKPDKTAAACKVLSIRGVKEVQVGIDEEILSPFTVQFSAETWTYSSGIFAYLIGIIIAAILLACITCFQKGWFFCPIWRHFQFCVDRHSILKERLRKGGSTTFEWVMKITFCALFNFDLITDFLYNFRVPFQSAWIKMISWMSLAVPVILSMAPWLVSLLFWLGMRIRLAFRIAFGREIKRQEDINEMYDKYVRRNTVYFLVVFANLIQFYNKDFEERFIEGKIDSQKQREIDRDREIDERLLELDSYKMKKTLGRNVINQFIELYPEDLSIIKEFQRDFTIFANAWEKHSDRGKGIRIKFDDKILVKFFQQMSEEELFEQKISNKEKTKLQQIQGQDKKGKEALQSIYEFDEETSEEITKGTHGVIYKSCLKNHKDFEVAIQVIDKKSIGKNETKKVKDAFEKIKEHAAHINIARYYQYFDDDKKLYLVMEYFERFTTGKEKLLQSKDENYDDKQDDDASQREQQAFTLIGQLLDALNTMHARGEVHGEVETDNIVIIGDDTLKLIDANLFRIEKEDDQANYYIAPELLKVEKLSKQIIKVNKPIQASDIWGVGVIMYNILSGGFQPFQSEEVDEVKEKILRHEKIPFDEDQFEGISSQAIELVKKMLEKDPKNRITAQQALADEWLRKGDVKFDKEEKKKHINVLKKLKKFRRRSMLKHMALMQLVQIIEDYQKDMDLEENDKDGLQELFEEKEELERVFKMIDDNYSSQLTKEELHSYYKEMGIEISIDKAGKIMNEVDFMGTGKLNSQEFVCATLDVGKIAETDHGQSLLRKIFQMFQGEDAMDRKGDCLTREEIIQAWKSFGQNQVQNVELTENDLDNIFIQHDLLKDATVRWEEFHTIFQNTENKDISKVYKQFLSDAKNQVTNHGQIEPAKHELDRKLVGKIHEAMQFIDDDGFVYYSEFVYKVFKFKYTKLEETNIFQIKVESLDKQLEQINEDFSNIDEEILDNVELMGRKGLLASGKSNQSPAGAYKSLPGDIEGLDKTQDQDEGTNKLVPVSDKLGATFRQKVSSTMAKMSQIIPEGLGKTITGLFGSQVEDQKVLILNKIFAIDVEAQFTQKQDTQMYFVRMKGIKISKHEAESKFLDKDLKQSVDLAWNKMRAEMRTKLNTQVSDVKTPKRETAGLRCEPLIHRDVSNQSPQVFEMTNLSRDKIMDENQEVSFEQFSALTELQNQRYSRMTEFEFIFPENLLKKKYDLLKELAELDGGDKVTIQVIKDYHTEKAKPFTIEIDEDDQEQNGQDIENQSEKERLISEESPLIEISQVNQIFQSIMDSRLRHYLDQVTKVHENYAAEQKAKKDKTKQNQDAEPKQSLKKEETRNFWDFKNLTTLFGDSKPNKSVQIKIMSDPVMKKFNKQLLKQKLKGARFKQLGIKLGDFSIIFGDKQDLAGSTPYIDNSNSVSFLNRDKYDDLNDPYMYPDQQMIIAKYKNSREEKFMVLQFDRNFKKIIDGGLYVEDKEYFDIKKFKCTHTFNNWLDKNRHQKNYYRRKFDFLTKDAEGEDMQQMQFILTKNDLEKDEEDKKNEKKIRKKVTYEHEEMQYEREKLFRQQVSIVKSLVAIVFGVLEDIPQLVIQGLNSIMIGETWTFLQVLSPILSFSSIIVRVYSIGTWDLFPEQKQWTDHYKDKWLAFCGMTCFNLIIIGICMVPIIYIVFNNFFTGQPETLDWVVANFDSIRKCEVSKYCFGIKE